MRNRRRFLILLETTDIFPVCLTLQKQSVEALKRDGMTADRSHRMSIKHVALARREKSGILVLFPILLRIMMNPVVSADISRRVTAVMQVRKCLVV